jgi:hypothetical protein
MSDLILIATMRASSAAIAAAGSTTDQRCAECGERVLLSPSSQSLLRDRGAECRIECLECLRAKVDSGEVNLSDCAMAGPPDRIAEEIARAVPNPWRKRN